MAVLHLFRLNSILYLSILFDQIGRSKPVGDITQIYTASLHKEHQSPKLERARGGKPVKDITQLYTAAFLNKSEPGAELSSPNRPRRNDNITKLYTGAFDGSANNFKSKPNDEITNPKKVNSKNVFTIPLMIKNAFIKTIV